MSRGPGRAPGYSRSQPRWTPRLTTRCSASCGRGTGGIRPSAGRIRSGDPSVLLCRALSAGCDAGAMPAPAPVIAAVRDVSSFDGSQSAYTRSIDGHIDFARVAGGHEPGGPAAGAGRVPCGVRRSRPAPGPPRWLSSRHRTAEAAPPARHPAVPHRPGGLHRSARRRDLGDGAPGVRGRQRLPVRPPASQGVRRRTPHRAWPHRLHPGRAHGRAGCRPVRGSRDGRQGGAGRGRRRHGQPPAARGACAVARPAVRRPAGRSGPARRGGAPHGVLSRLRSSATSTRIWCWAATTTSCPSCAG